MKTKRSERGQVLVLILLSLVGMFGFAAIAIDGGRYFAERRRAQNAADAAAYAAAFAGINGNNYRTAGIASTQNNGYNDTNGAVNVGADEDVQIYRPPTRGRYSVATETIDPDEYYQVIIRYRVDQVFSQIVYNGDLWVEVEAVARGTGHGGFGSEAAIVAICADCCPGIKFTGGAQLLVEGGDIVSNSNPTPENCDSAELKDNESCVIIKDGDLITVGSLYDHGSTKCDDGKVALDPGHAVYENTGNPENYFYPHTPSCSGLDVDPAFTEVKVDKVTTRTYYPGVYTGGIKITNSKLNVQLMPGMYCLDDDFAVSSGSLAGSNVMFYMRGDTSVAINNSGTSVALSAPTGLTDCIQDPVLEDVCWSGFLFFSDVDNGGNFAIAGGAGNTYRGTIYMPGAPDSPGSFKCSISGGTKEEDKLTLVGSLICYTVDVSGSKSINVQYEENTSMQPTGAIEISE